MRHPVLSHLSADKLAITLTSFIPYRAHVTSASGGVLETFRVFLPGYRAQVDGVAVPVTASKNHLVAFAVPPGDHEVELRFVGSAQLWLAAFVSGIGWICLLGACARKAFSRHEAAG